MRIFGRLNGGENSWHNFSYDVPTSSLVLCQYIRYTQIRADCYYSVGILTGGRLCHKGHKIGRTSGSVHLIPRIFKFRKPCKSIPGNRLLIRHYDAPGVQGGSLESQSPIA